MRIMYDHQIFSQQEFGGVSRYHIELAKEIRKIKGVNVSIPIIFNKNEYLLNSYGIKKNIKIENRISNFFFHRANIVNSLLEARKNDIIHLTWTNPYLFNRTNNKIIITIHDMIHELFWNKNKSAQSEIQNKKYSIYHADGIIAISKNTKKDILKIYPDIPEEKIKIIYHGTNHLPKGVKPYYNLPEKYILYVGRRDDYKGFDFMVSSLQFILKNFKNIKLLVVGGAPFSNSERKKYDEMGIINSIHHVSASDSELAYIYKNAICFVYPSLYEGFGAPLLEAFDNECPVVCTNISSLPEIGGNAAEYFDVGDSEKLEEIVQSYIKSNDKRDEAIKKGKKRADEFTYEKCSRETYDFYKKILNC